MNIQHLQAEINAIHQDTAQMDDSARAILNRLLNLVERLAGENAALESERQALRDEINRLKGEQGKPDIKADKKKAGDISSEAERKAAEANANQSAGSGGIGAGGKKTRRRDAKLPKIRIDREEVCQLDKSGLPDDLEFKGYEDVVAQDLTILTDNVKYRREVYYSPSQRKSYRGELPEGVRGQGGYGPGIRALIPVLKTEGNLSEKRMLGFFRNFGIEVSAAYLSRQWTGGYELFHREKSDLYRSGIANSGHVQVDATGGRVNGVNQHCHIVCSPLFTAYHTTPAKDRLTVLALLTDFAPPRYIYNRHARGLLDLFNLSGKARAAIDAQLPPGTAMDGTEFKARLARTGLGIRQSARLAEACAIAYYQQQTEFPVIDTLLADDAPQFKLLTRCLGLCWVHDGRHYKKLMPVVAAHQGALADFRGRYWGYYTELLRYKLGPTPEKKAWLSEQFDGLFATATGYEDLDARIAKTLAKKTELLRVLELPQLPLHNNDAELGARVQARVRDVSYQTRSEQGTKIKDTFMTINQTAKKLGVSFYDYVYDRVAGYFKLPSLADLIAQKAQALPI